MTTSTSSDPFKVLGLPKDASEATVRARYLELVKQFPPEREPDKFREVQAAFEAAKDPLLIARQLLESPSEGAPRWSDAIDAQKLVPPALTPTLLLSLGNREDTLRRQEGDAEHSETAGDQATSSDPAAMQHFVEQSHE